jgi:hypothetical protein
MQAKKEFLITVNFNHLLMLDQDHEQQKFALSAGSDEDAAFQGFPEMSCVYLSDYSQCPLCAI